MNSELTIGTITTETLCVLCSELVDDHLEFHIDKFGPALKKVKASLMESGYSEQGAKEIMIPAIGEVLARTGWMS